ncbi:MAG: hypothetical protein WC822_05770 [Candidatus Paceibacterota bacterium]|jgi:hypothetical protein
MKKQFSSFAVLILVLFSFLSTPISAQLVSGHALKNGQVILGVTGSAPVAQAIAGTSNQITVTSTYTENGSIVMSFPNSVIFPGSVQVLGTLSPTSTSYTYNDLTIVYGVNTATIVVTGASDFAGDEYHGAANYRSTFTASSGALALTGALTANGNIVMLGNEYRGAANYVSTFTASSGAQAWTGALTSNGAITALGNEYHGAANFVSTFTASSGQLALGGAFLLKSKTLAQLDALTGVVGAAFYCSDCTSTAICVGSGTAAGAFVDFSSPTVHCDTKK